MAHPGLRGNGHAVLCLYSRQQAKRDVVCRRHQQSHAAVVRAKANLVPGFTRKYGVDQLAYFEAFDSILEARAREHSLKRWRRAWKVALIEKLNPDWFDLTDKLNF